MSSKPEFRRILRRLKSSSRGLPSRSRSELFCFESTSVLPKLLLDTTVYIDELHGRIGPAMELALEAASIWHSTVVECELAAVAGLLDPDHPRTASAIDKVLSALERWPTHRVINPDREVWREAGVLAGILARTQQYGKAEQRRVLNDALIFLSAAKAGLTVLTRNLSDFDLLMQIAPHGHALFYDIEQEA